MPDKPLQRLQAMDRQGARIWQRRVLECGRRGASVRRRRCQQSLLELVNMAQIVIEPFASYITLSLAHHRRLQPDWRLCSFHTAETECCELLSIHVANVLLCYRKPGKSGRRFSSFVKLPSEYLPKYRTPVFSTPKPGKRAVLPVPAQKLCADFSPHNTLALRRFGARDHTYEECWTGKCNVPGSVTF